MFTVNLILTVAQNGDTYKRKQSSPLPKYHMGQFRLVKIRNSLLPLE